MDLIVDEARVAEEGWYTGIPVRAKLREAWGAHDIATLTEASLEAWLRSRDCNEFAISLIKHLLGR